MNEGRRKKEEGRRRFLYGDWDTNSKRASLLRSGWGIEKNTEDKP
jgi:hypothetical protein